MEDKFNKPEDKNRIKMRKKYDIPFWLIIIAFVIATPLGVILLILSFVEEPVEKNSTGAASHDFQSFADTVRAAWSSSELQGLSDMEKLNRISEKRRRERREAEEKAKAEQEQKLKKRKNGKRKRTLPETASLAVAIIALFVGVMNLLDIDSGTVLGLSTVINLCLPLVTAAVGFGFASFFKRRSERFAVYSLLIGDSDSFDLSALASAADTSVKRVRRDLQDMISNGEFGALAYIDVKKGFFFRSPEVASDFEKNSKLRNMGDEKQAKDRVERDEYREIILEIRRLNDEIADIAVSDRIYRIEELSQQIFDYVKENPETRPNIRTFMNYYLPTTMKLLTSYAKIEKAGVAGDNMRRSKENIEGTLDLLVYAFEKQLDSLFASESLDINSDIDVLEAMLNRDGMSKSIGGELKLGGVAAEEKKYEK